MKITDYIRDIKDFPKEGVIFKDITPLLNHVEARNKALELLVQQLNGKKIDKVIGVESRGFFFGTLLAQELNAGFVPVRKPKKLPYSTISQEYELEYGFDTLEIHIDAISPGDKVLLHDDVLATGGTAEAVCKLIEKLGGEIVQCNFLMELDFLNGKEKLKNYDVQALIHYS